MYAILFRDVCQRGVRVVQQNADVLNLGFGEGFLRAGLLTVGPGSLQTSFGSLNKNIPFHLRDGGEERKDCHAHGYRRIE